MLLSKLCTPNLSTLKSVQKNNRSTNDQPTSERSDLYYNDEAICTGMHTYKDGVPQ